MERQSKDQYLMSIAYKAAQRATCNRAMVGCVISIDGHIISTGYNGSLPKQPHCTMNNCVMRENHCVRTVHAEQNAIGWCANQGISTDGAYIYCTHFPCLTCAKLIITSGIIRVVYHNDYRVDDLALEFFRQSCVLVEQLDSD